MKKKILSLTLVVCLLAIAVVGGTMAYFTDKDAELNTFTFGNIDIDLEETFVADSELVPGLDVNKDAWIENTGDNAAWVWAEVLIPVQLDDGIANSPAAPGLANSLHMNYPGMYAKEYAQNTDATAKFYNENLSQLWIMQHNADDVQYGYLGKETIGTVEYNKYIKFYEKPLYKGESTSLFLDKVYMDKTVKQCTEHANCLKLVDGSCYTGDWEILVRAYGIQETGFASVIDAWKAYDGTTPVA